MRLRRPTRFARRRHERTGCLSFAALALVLLSIATLLQQRWLPSLLPQGNQEALPTLADVQAAFSSGDLRGAIAGTSRLYAAHPHDLTTLTWLVRALIYYSESDFNRAAARERALTLTRDALRTATLPRDVYALHALALYANGQHNEAVRFALRALDRNPDDVLALVALAGAYASTGLFEAGLRNAERAVALTAGASSLAWDAGRAYAFALAGLGRFREALAAAERASSLARALLPLHFERAHYALQLADYNTATSAYFTVIAFDGANVKARFRLCEVSSQRREMAAALDFCTQVTQRSPAYAPGWHMLGREYFLQGKFRQAQQALNRCTTLEVQQNVPIHQRQFECWYFQGQAAEILGDCPALLSVYHQFQQMARAANLPQTWVYPPEGPAICQPPTASP